MKERAIDAGGSYVDVALEEVEIPEADVNKQYEETKKDIKKREDAQKEVIDLQNKGVSVYLYSDNIPADYINPEGGPDKQYQTERAIPSKTKEMLVYEQKTDMARKTLALNEIAEKENIDLDNISDLEYGQLMQRQDVIDLANSYPKEITEDSTKEEKDT